MTYELYQGDCLEFMRGMDAGSVDAIISDPQYGINYSPSQNSSKAWGKKTFVGKTVVKNDDKPFDPTPFLVFKTIVLFGANHYANKLPNSSGWIVWDKRDGMTSNDFADCELIWTNRGNVARVFKHVWSGAIRASEKNEPRVHPTQKPIKLMAWLIERFTAPGSTIFDPFMGSGTTGVAALQLGRHFIGCELDPGYFAIAQARIEAAARQPSLFQTTPAAVQPQQSPLFG